MNMNTFAQDLYRDLACATAAILITFVLSMSFVVSTAVPPGTRAPATWHMLARSTQPGWFGQPQPAVLVD
jgi:hypothetical protein